VTFIATAAEAAEHYATHVVGQLRQLVHIGETPAAREMARGLPANVKPIVITKLAGDAGRARRVVRRAHLGSRR
jgi:hypothetical protein